MDYYIRVLDSLDNIISSINTINIHLNNIYYFFGVLLLILAISFLYCFIDHTFFNKR